MKSNDSGEYVAAHVSQATKTYQQLMASGVPVQGYEQRGDTVYFRTQRPAPLPKRRSRWWVWIIGAVLALFAIAAMLKAGILAASVGASMAGVLLFGTLLFFVWKISDRPGVGFVGTTIAGLVCAVLMIGAFTSVEPMWDADAAAQQSRIAAECGGIGGGDIQCRWDNLVESGERLAEIAQKPENEGLGGLVVVMLAVMVGGGWAYWKSQGL